MQSKQKVNTASVGSRHPKETVIQTVAQSREDQRSKKLCARVMELMVAGGHYQVHPRQTLRSSFSLRPNSRGAFDSDVILKVENDICCNPPDKQQLLAVLYEQLLKDMGLPDDDEQKMPQDWLWQLIAKVSMPCDHQQDWHQEGHIRMRLLSNCMMGFPLFDPKLGLPAALLEPPTLSRGCCDLLEAATKEGRVQYRYGLTVTMDIMKWHANDAALLVATKAKQAMGQWEQLAMQELLAFVTDGQPQEQLQPEPQMQAAMDVLRDSARQLQPQALRLIFAEQVHRHEKK